MGRAWATGAVLLGCLTLVGPAAPAAQAPASVPRPQESHASLDTARGNPHGRMLLDNFRFIGHSRLDGSGDYGDVAANNGIAYVGSRCGAEDQGGEGVQVVDYRRPRHPRLVSELPNEPFTRAEDVVALEVRTPSFRGDLAVVGIQTCFGSGHEQEVVPGLRLFDVTRPRAPRLLAEWDLPQGTAGCHEIDAVQRADGTVLAVCARNLIDHIRSNGQFATHIVDITDPRQPRVAADWSLDIPVSPATGCLPFRFAHSARFTDGGSSLYVSYWDEGTVHLDVSDPAAPQVVSKTSVLPPDEDGDNHSMTLAHGGDWLVINTEDFCPDGSGWGEVYVFDNRDPAAPRFLGTFSTPNSRSTRTDGVFTDHNTEVAPRDQHFSSWYSDGIVWWTMNGQGVSHQRGQFVPPPTGEQPPEVWGVALDSRRDLVLASDMNSGLWIVKPRGARL